MTIDSVAALRSVIYQDKCQHWLREGAQPDEVTRLERQVGMQLPAEYAEFLKYSDGAVLFQTEELLGTKPGWEHDESIADAKERLKKQTPPLPASLIPFHKSGTVHCFSKIMSRTENDYSVIEWNSDTGQIMDKYENFFDWINRYLIPVGEGRL